MPRTIASVAVARRLLVIVAVALVAFIASDRASAAPVLNQPLDALPTGANISNPDAAEMIPGRLAGQQALLIRKGTAAFTFDGVDNDAFFVEFWIKPHAWDALAEAEVTIAEFAFEGQTVVLRKPADEPVVQLLLDGQSVQAYPVYSWTQQPWMSGGANAKDLWHYVNLGVTDGRLNLTIDGFTAQRLGNEAVVTGAPGSITFHGAPGTGFASLHVLDDEQPTGDALRDRYRAMYRGELPIRRNTITVPHIASSPKIDGQFDSEQWQHAARIANFTSLRNPRGQVVAEDVTAYLAYDDKRLYMAFHTPYEGALDATVWDERDRPLWGEESFEIFLLPPWTGQPDYRQLVGNPHGDQTDLLVFDDSWHGRWDWTTHLTDDTWTAEFQASFAGLDAPHPGELDIWNINIFNTRANAAFSWALAYHDIGAFGVLRFDRDAPVLRPDRYEITDEFIRAPIEVRGGLAARDLTLKLEVFAPSDVLPAGVDTQRLTAKPDEQHELMLEVPRHGLEEGKIIVSISDDADELYYHAIEFPHADPAIRQMREVSSDDADQNDDGAVTDPEQMTEAERAYARKWTDEELGETLLDASNWRNNTIGLDDDVPSPWTPMEVEGQTVKMWGRSYVYKDSILPVQTYSQGEPLFASAPHFVLAVDGETLEFRDAQVDIEQVSDSLVRVNTTSAVGPYVLRLQKEYEFDGMARVEAMLISPDSVESVDEFHLVFPLRRETSTLFHWATPHSGHPPYTDSGAVSDEGIELDLFRHLTWLGNESKGFTWFAESLKGFEIVDEDRIQVVEATAGDRRDLKIKFADRTFELKEPWELLFGIQATPTRPRAADFRELSTASAMRFPWRWGDGEYYIWQSDHVEAARDHVHEVHDEGRYLMPVSSLQFYGQFRYYANPFGKLSHPGMMNREIMLWGSLWERTQLHPGLPEIPERHTAAGDWYGRDTHPRESTGGRLARLCSASPFQDYYLYRLEQLVDDTELSAIYLDQPMSACSNPYHGCGFIDYKGEWAGRYPIFDERRMVRRIHRVLDDGGVHDKPLIRWHSSNHIIVPVLSFADIFWDGENYLYGPLRVQEFYSKVLPEARLRAQHTGLPFGFAPDLLPELSKNQDDRYAPSPASVRDMMGLFMVHDSTVFPLWTMHNSLVRFMLDQRRAFPLDRMDAVYYWQNDPRIDVQHDNVRFILHHGDDAALLILFNWSDEALNVPVTMDVTSLGITGQPRVYDTITGQLISSETEAFQVPLLPRDMRMIELRQ